ncbi:LxmA leader domain family RiPP [Streptomyces sp. CRN 30]|nr:LxmA leader domain family RiPP [Streptomyces sp. CRN 30]
MNAEKLIEGYDAYTTPEELAYSPEAEAPASSPAVLTTLVIYLTFRDGC